MLWQMDEKYAFASAIRNVRPRILMVFCFSLMSQKSDGRRDRLPTHSHHELQGAPRSPAAATLSDSCSCLCTYYNWAWFTKRKMLGAVFRPQRSGFPQPKRTIDG